MMECPRARWRGERRLANDEHMGMYNRMHIFDMHHAVSPVRDLLPEWRLVMTNEEAILKHFRKPKSIPHDLWEMTDFGDKWVETAIADLCQRMEAAETALRTIAKDKCPGFEMVEIAHKALAKIGAK